MKTLIVSDIHERVDKIKHIEKAYFDKADRIVLLGDFFDTFNARRPEEMIHWLLPKLYQKRVTVLWGNHDISYAFPKNRCSGYSEATQAVVDREMGRADWLQFKPWTTVGPFLVSHAGFVKETLPLKDEAEQAVLFGLKGTPHRYWAAGYARGGPVPIGGPVWLDWNFEFEPIPHQPQIVGHTVISNGPPKQKDNSYCLDTSNRHVMWVDEETGEVEIVEVH